MLIGAEVHSCKQEECSSGQQDTTEQRAVPSGVLRRIMKRYDKLSASDKGSRATVRQEYHYHRPATGWAEDSEAPSLPASASEKPHRGDGAYAVVQ